MKIKNILIISMFSIFLVSCNNEKQEVDNTEIKYNYQIQSDKNDKDNDKHNEEVKNKREEEFAKYIKDKAINLEETYDNGDIKIEVLRAQRNKEQVLLIFEYSGKVKNLQLIPKAYDNEFIALNSAKIDNKEGTLEDEKKGGIYTAIYDINEDTKEVYFTLNIMGEDLPKQQVVYKLQEDINYDTIEKEDDKKEEKNE